MNEIVPRTAVTTTEGARAASEVQAMVTVAQARPRDEVGAMTQMKLSCGEKYMAELAFYRFSRGGEQITGPTIQLAVELARCWGNMSYGVNEISRDSGESHMQAWAWDLQQNMRASTEFVVPHERSKRTGKVALDDPRDIYENNANQAARRLREMILRVLPPWFREHAIEACNATLQGDKAEMPMNVRVNTMLEAFAKIGVTRARIEARLGSNANEMTPVDLAQLGIAFRAIQRGESNKEMEFPTVAAMDVARKLAEEDADAAASSGPGG